MPSPSVPDRELDEESPSRHVGREALAVAVIAIVVCLSGIVAAASAPALHTTLASTGKAYLTDVSAQRAGPAESASTPTTTTTPTTTATTATTATPPVLPTPAPAPGAPAARPAPAAPEAPTPPPEPPTSGSLARALSALVQSIPAEWLAALPVDLSLRTGSISYAYPTGVIEISEGHAISRWSTLVLVTTHEFGHQIAYRYGTQAYFGAAPEGWPYAGASPEERWADCVAIVFTGPNRYASCPDDALAWTADWLAAGPAAHSLTG